MLETTAGIPGAVPLPEQAGVSLRPVRKGDASRLSSWLKRLPEDERPFAPAGCEFTGVQHWLRAKNSGDNRGRHFIILHRGQPAGLIGWLESGKLIIFLSPDTPRRQGIGTKALRLAVYMAKLDNRYRLVIAVLRAADFFIKNGFVEEAYGYQLSPRDRAFGAKIFSLRVKGQPRPWNRPAKVHGHRRAGYTPRRYVDGLA